MGLRGKSAAPCVRPKSARGFFKKYCVEEHCATRVEEEEQALPFVLGTTAELETKTDCAQCLIKPYGFQSDAKWIMYEKIHMIRALVASVDAVSPLLIPDKALAPVSKLDSKETDQTSRKANGGL